MQPYGVPQGPAASQKKSPVILIAVGVSVLLVALAVVVAILLKGR